MPRQQLAEHFKDSACYLERIYEGVTYRSKEAEAVIFNADVPVAYAFRLERTYAERAP